jgi:hypothetical protein
MATNTTRVLSLADRKERPDLRCHEQHHEWIGDRLDAAAADTLRPLPPPFVRLSFRGALRRI